MGADELGIRKFNLGSESVKIGSLELGVKPSGWGCLMCTKRWI